MATLEEHLNRLSVKQIKNIVREHNLHTKIRLGQPKETLIAQLLEHFEELVDGDMISSIYKIKVPTETDIVQKKGRARAVNPNLQKPAITQQEINPGEAVLRQMIQPKRKTGTLISNNDKANLQEAVRIPEEKVAEVEHEPEDVPVEEENDPDNYPPEPYTMENGEIGIITRKRYPPEAKPFPKEKQKTATYKNKEWKIGDFVYVVRGNDKNKRGKIVKFEGDKAIINKVDYHYARWDMVDGQYESGRKIYYYIDPSIPGTRFSAGLGNIVKMPYEYDADSGR